MPYASKKQARYIHALANGSIKNKSFSQEEAKKFTKDAGGYKDLPEKAKKKKRFSGLLD